MKQGQVILVGAGPGDPGLLTVKGRQAILDAEVVVYDRLVSQPILDLIPPNAEKINVGKASSHHLVPQERINQILLEKARDGKRVVRLKGGDPFLFGRGGEELELLEENGIAFQEIPGITSAIAVPAYGGIPVTHRDFCSSLHIITGHRRAGEKLEIAFDALVKAGGTLVFLMGVSAVGDICTGLLDAGMQKDMPAAIIEKGTTPGQRTVLATLSALPETCQKEKVQSPAIIVVGKVCALSERFDWFDHLPLKGKNIIVTRPKNRAQGLSEQLRLLGASVTEFPCIETVPMESDEGMARAIENMDSYQWLAFTSPAGVAMLMDMLEKQGQDVRALGGIRLAVIGPGTARELKKHGLRADLMPEIYDGAHLGQALSACKPVGKVLILRSKQGSRALTEELDGGSISYDDVPSYETRCLKPDPEPVRHLLGDCVVTFTSASTVKGFVAAVGQENCSAITAACIGKQTEAEAKKYNLHTITAREATVDALIQRIVEGV